MARLTYNPDVFDVPDERAARDIILTPEFGLSTDERWEKETPYLGELFAPQLNLKPDQVLVDYGCGLGRMAKEMIRRTGCRVLGVDISEPMRGLAPGYVGSRDFSVVSPRMFASLVANGFRADAAMAIWVLQHCLSPAQDIEALKVGLKPGGMLAVVNNKHRSVPTKEKAWASDGVDVRALLNERFGEVNEGALEPSVVTPQLSANTYWAVYRR